MAKSNRPKKRQNNDRAKGKQQDIKRRDFFDVLTLLIALFGAISGGYATYKEFKKPSQIGFHINFNKPTVCPSHDSANILSYQ